MCGAIHTHATQDENRTHKRGEREIQKLTRARKAPADGGQTSMVTIKLLQGRHRSDKKHRKGQKATATKRAGVPADGTAVN